VHGQQLSVNDDFATQVIYIARVLDCSERHIAGLMQHVISNNPNLTPVYILEEVVLEHHQRRHELADSLRLLLEASEISPITALHACLQHFVKTQVIPSEGADSILFGEKGLGWTVSLKIEAIDKTLSQALAAKQNAGGDTVLQGLSSLFLTVTSSHLSFTQAST
jgi:nuclear pore complex protein Nup205